VGKAKIGGGAGGGIISFVQQRDDLSSVFAFGRATGRRGMTKEKRYVWGLIDIKKGELSWGSGVLHSGGVGRQLLGDR